MEILCNCFMCFFFKGTATTEIYTFCHPLSLNDALPIYPNIPGRRITLVGRENPAARAPAHGTAPPSNPDADAGRVHAGAGEPDLPRAISPPARTQRPDRKSTRLNSSH